MKTKLLILPIYLILTGCNDKTDILASDEIVSQQISETKRKQEMKSSTNFLGVSQKDGLIIIDTNKTKHILHNMANTLKIGVNNASDAIKKGRVDSIKDVGIFVDNNKITIDINKTTKFVNRWKNSMEDAVNQMDEAIQQIEKSLPAN